MKVCGLTGGVGMGKTTTARLLGERGVVTIDTDAHAPGQLEWQRFGCEQAVASGVPSERVMNTRPIDEFLAWTASHDQ